MELQKRSVRLYQVRRGQTLVEIAAYFLLPPELLAAVNALGEEVEEGQILLIPEGGRSLYRVRGGESKTLLCGSVSAFAQRNQTERFYIGQVIFL